MVYDKLPGEIAHGWKFIKIGPDNKLCVPVGAPCNICESDDRFTKIFRMNLDGSNVETFVHGMRNTVGFDFHPKTGNLRFTDNQRDWLSEDLSEPGLNHVTKAGRHFGYPYCHAGDFADPELGWGKNCADYPKPVAKLGVHSAPLGPRRPRRPRPTMRSAGRRSAPPATASGDRARCRGCRRSAGSRRSTSRRSCSCSATADAPTIRRRRR